MAQPESEASRAAGKDKVLAPILVVDDDPDDLFLAKRLLLRAGAGRPIITVGNGEEARLRLLAAAQPSAAEQMPAMVFCDLKMPRMDGFEILGWVRANPIYLHLPFFTLSGSHLQRDIERALALGANGYLVKFPQEEAIGEIVHTVVAGRGGSLSARVWPSAL